MDSALVDQTSEQFLGQWRHLVSTTNWEKGRIIFDWREALKNSDSPAAEYADEAWSRRVGNVTPQHVGRLRRVYERFDNARDEYAGLFWSHFQAALDWDDAEMWLEGAVQSQWSIADMRRQRAEANGAVDDEESADEVAAAEPWDEDADSGESVDAALSTVSVPDQGSDEYEADESESDDGADDESGYDRSEFDDESASAADSDREAVSEADSVAPFAELPPLPPDVNDAFEAFKLCILRHKLAGWQDISRADLLGTLDALKQLAMTSADA
jgi:hypothetical protein